MDVWWEYVPESGGQSGWKTKSKNAIVKMSLARCARQKDVQWWAFHSDLITLHSVYYSRLDQLGHCMSATSGMYYFSSVYCFVFCFFLLRKLRFGLKKGGEPMTRNWSIYALLGFSLHVSLWIHFSFFSSCKTGVIFLFSAPGRNICSRIAQQKSHPTPTITPFIPRSSKT